jgi:hypothetical protein
VDSAQKSGLRFVQYFFRDGVEEMMRNANCFVNDPYFYFLSFVTECTTNCFPCTLLLRFVG